MPLADVFPAFMIIAWVYGLDQFNFEDWIADDMSQDFLRSFSIFDTL